MMPQKEVGRGQATLNRNMAFKLGLEWQETASQAREQSIADRGTAHAKAPRCEKFDQQGEQE